MIKKQKMSNQRIVEFNFLDFGFECFVCFEFRDSDFGFPFRNGLRKGYFLLSNSFAAATTWSGSKPNFLWSSFSGADAPNVFMPIMRPDLPTYRSHPKVDACSTATRAVTFGGRTLS